MIPRRLFWLFDLIVIAVGVSDCYRLIPHSQPLFAPSSHLRTLWVEYIFALYASARVETPWRDFAWVLLLMPRTIWFLGLFGKHTSLPICTGHTEVLHCPVSFAVCPRCLIYFLCGYLSHTDSRISLRNNGSSGEKQRERYQLF